MRNRSNEILIAIIGLVGVLATGVLSNWDKLTSKNPIIQAQAIGYQPTGDFNTEVRYYLEITGMRATIESYTKRYLETSKMELLAERPQDAAKINEYFDTMGQEMIKYDDLVNSLLPVYQKHFTVLEIQELNKFYSTHVMRELVRKGPAVAEDIIPIQQKLTADMLRRIQERIQQKAQSHVPD